MEGASIGLITSNYSLRALQNEGPSSTITFILYIMSRWRDKRCSYQRGRRVFKVLMWILYTTVVVFATGRSFHFQFNKLDLYKLL